MGVLADRLDDMQVQATSPDGHISGLLRNRSEVFIAFRPGSYVQYDEHRLQEQLGALARLLWAGRTREYYAAISERDRAYRSARDELVAEGMSADGLVYIGVRGMRTWAVRIADGALRSLREQDFTERAYEASHAMILDQFAKIRQLKDYCYADAP